MNVQNDSTSKGLSKTILLQSSDFVVMLNNNSSNIHNYGNGTGQCADNDSTIHTYGNGTGQCADSDSNITGRNNDNSARLRTSSERQLWQKN